MRRILLLPLLLLGCATVPKEEPSVRWDPVPPIYQTTPSPITVSLWYSRTDAPMVLGRATASDPRVMIEQLPGPVTVDMKDFRFQFKVSLPQTERGMTEVGVYRLQGEVNGLPAPLTLRVEP